VGQQLPRIVRLRGNNLFMLLVVLNPGH